MDRIITIATDFGLKDPYLGAMKGVILSINPNANIVDITHLISPQNIIEGSLVLSQYYNLFPKGTIHMFIVDPGVGSKRRPILIETGGYFFIGPDNGIFTSVLKKEKIVKTIHLKNKKYFLKEVSNTFHGRDIFAPAAAHLSLGIEPERFGESIDKPCMIEVPLPRKKGNAILGKVIYMDSFGNLITNIRGDYIKGFKSIEIGKIKINRISKSYSDGKGEKLIALIGSFKYLEIACYKDAASKVLNTKEGGDVIVRCKNV